MIGVNDEGNAMELSADPMLEELRNAVGNINLGDKYDGEIREILKNEQIFGVNLVECGLAEKIEQMFAEMIADKGAVTSTLEKYCG